MASKATLLGGATAGFLGLAALFFIAGLAGTAWWIQPGTEEPRLTAQENVLQENVLLTESETSLWQWRPEAGDAINLSFDRDMDEDAVVFRLTGEVMDIRSLTLAALVLTIVAAPLALAPQCHKASASFASLALIGTILAAGAAYKAVKWHDFILALMCAPVTGECDFEYDYGPGFGFHVVGVVTACFGFVLGSGAGALGQASQASPTPANAHRAV